MSKPLRMSNLNHPNEGSVERRARSHRGEIRKVEPKTPNRNCINHAVVVEDGKQVVYYLHVTKGHRRRLLTTINLDAQRDVLFRAQKYAMGKHHG